MREPTKTFLRSPSRGPSLLLHAVGLVLLVNAYRYLVDMTAALNVPYIWHLQFLTIIGLTLSTTTYSIAFLADIFVSRSLTRIKNVLAAPSLALEVVVTTLYWGMMAINPKLLMAEMDFVISKEADLSFHLAPFILLLLDFFLFSPPSTHTPLSASLTAGTLAAGYWFWLEQTRQWWGWYPYPFLNHLTGVQRLAFFLMSSSIAAGAVMFLVWLRKEKDVETATSGNGVKGKKVQ
ncbi:hypothetical protein BJ508DRAFT_412397 [Ascobolus immersus RN42]|uniref:FAR-17a/AIG1-like protein n=1 Tax=Ascobolus immersus RN42 TaxID=1160509 RepID=A0A3N4ITP6_ASCIM|nr:hypothetical protein BJ508DRAFT_412397 [Ascobolus immersus RN42]